ncbi:phosphatidylserine decarboxylase, partial [Kitasatospora sp. NPDC047058]|uniref:phosphatidylserine decarboxylase n=1 Tax=Kitasatospora sp. NPDC047058 TaxID=3155620 RepID=UPI0033FE52E0
VREYDEFWVKGQPYSLRDMLNGSVHTADFIGGSVFQSFLSGADYHRWRSPVAGRVLSAEVVDGLMFSNAESAGRDEDAGVLSQAYQSSVNTRGLVFIEADDPRIGKVCVMPVGITEISSVTIEVEAGRRVEKGTELGYFSYGGSSLCLVFQPGTVEFPAGMVKGTPIRVNAQLARVIRS